MMQESMQGDGPEWRARRLAKAYLYYEMLAGAAERFYDSSCR